MSSVINPTFESTYFPDLTFEDLQGVDLNGDRDVTAGELNDFILRNTGEGASNTKVLQDLKLATEHPDGRGSFNTQVDEAITELQQIATNISAAVSENTQLGDDVDRDARIDASVTFKVRGTIGSPEIRELPEGPQRPELPELPERPARPVLQERPERINFNPS